MLSDPQEARRLRPVRPRRRRSAAWRGGGAAPEGFGGFAEAFGDIFGDIFGGSSGAAAAAAASIAAPTCATTWRSRWRKPRAAPRRKIRIPALEECETCNGNGAKPGTQPKTCPTCHGQAGAHVAGLLLASSRPARNCHGSGKIIPEPCATCHGAGRVKKHKTLSVKIPAGVDEGIASALRQRRAGRQRRAARRPLRRRSHLKPHAVFQRDGDDLHCEMPVGFATAALGGEIEIPTLDGQAKIKIPPETQTGKMFRLRGKGIKGVRAQLPGDLYCHVAVETPVKLTVAAEGTAARVRGDQRAGSGRAQPAREELVRQGKRILRALR